VVSTQPAPAPPPPDPDATQARPGPGRCTGRRCHAAGGDSGRGAVQPRATGHSSASSGA